MGVDFSSSSEFVWLLAGCAVLLGLLFLCRKLRDWRMMASGRDAHADACLHAAMADKAVFGIAMRQAEAGDIQHLNGVCKGIEKGRLRLLSESQAVEPVLGASVEVSFVLTRGEQVGLYCFDSTVLGFFPEDGGYSIELALPEKLRNIQRRAFVRCAPPISVVRDCFIWDIALNDGAVAGELSMNSPRFNASDVFLSNLSAGGVKFHFIAPPSLDDEGQLLAADGSLCSHMLIYLRLQGPAGSNDLRVWLLGKVLRVEPVGQEVGVSLKFLRWRNSQGEGGNLPWSSVDATHGVEPVLSWVLQADLAKRRDEADSPFFGESDSAERLAIFLRDPLTGVANEAFFLAHTEGLLERCRAQQQPLGCIVLEILHPEGIRTTCGQAGLDHVLKTAAFLICRSVRVNDMVGRVGENRFYIALPETDLTGVRVLAGRQRRMVESCSFPLDSGARLSVSVRTGCAALSRGQEDFFEVQSLLRAADVSLEQTEQA